LEEGFGNVAIEQAFAVLGKHGHVPDAVIHVQTHEPAEQQVVVELFHQHPFAAHRVQRLQQERSQQLLRRDRRRPILAYKLLNRGFSCCSASSVMARSERNGWSCGTRCSGLI